MKVVFQKFLADESGATAIEYGLIAAGIAIAIITAVQGVGSQLSTNFNSIKTELIKNSLTERPLSQRGEPNSEYTVCCCPAKETWSGFSLPGCGSGRRLRAK